MNTKKSLVWGQGLLFLIIFVSFGIIIVTEKAGEILSPKIKEKINTYLKENYTDIKETFKQNEINYKSTKYKMKITSKDNENLYFYVTYQRGKISDTYKKDYLEGDTLLSSLEESMQKEIKNKTGTSYTVKINNKLNEYNSKVQERIINEDNLLNLKFYNLQTELLIENWNYQSITDELISKMNKAYNQGITPKYYEFTIINSKDITTSITISNLEESFITNPNNYQIIYSILQNENTDILNNSKITYTYNK